LEKIRREIDRMNEVYDLMETFEYKFSEEDYRKKWHVFAGPKEILELIEE